MKKALAVILCISLCGVFTFAAGAKDSSSFEGKLAVTDALPYITTAKDEILYLPARAFYQIAWENSIKAGDTIKAEGFQRKIQPPDGTEEKTFLIPSKVWVNGREIDLTTVRMPGEDFHHSRVMQDGRPRHTQGRNPPPNHPGAQQRRRW